MTPLSHHSSNLSLIARQTMRLLVRICKTENQTLEISLFGHKLRKQIS